MSNATTGALTGAASGAAIGSLAGPVGTAVGAGVGFIGGLFMGMEADAEEARLERERIAQLKNTSNMERAQRDQAQQLAEAALNTGSDIGQSGYDSPTGLLGDMISRNETNGSGNKTSSAGTF